MAGNRFQVNSELVDTGSSTKTLLQLTAAANIGIHVSRIEVSFNGSISSSVPIRVDILRQTTAGTANSVVTPKKDDDNNDDTIQATAGKDYTAEPTPGDILRTRFVHPQGSYTWAFSRDEWMPLHGSARLGVRVLANAAVSGIVVMSCEE